MKKYILYLFAGALAFTFIPVEIQASTALPKMEAPASTIGTRVTLANRLEEISKIDKSTLSYSEKRDLRNEERSIKESMNDGYNGVYISVGTLIIIILILIILL